MCSLLGVLRVSWFALFTLMWRIQGVTPATLTAVGLLRTTVYGPFQYGAKESCFQSLTTPDPQAQIRESVPQGGMAPFLVKTSVQFSSVAQSCLTLCDPMNHSTPGLPIHHHLPEFIHTHVHESPNTARQAASLPGDISRGKRSSMPQPKTRPDSPVPSLQGPCDRSLKSEVPCGSCLNWR